MSKALSRVALVRQSTIPINPTSKDVKDFWQFMQKKYNTTIIQKKDSAEMKFVAEFLDLLGILDKQAFLNRYTTTLGKKIYVPHPIGSDLPGWDLWGQIVICVHEHVHIDQDNKAGDLIYEWAYVTNTASRTQYEVEAYRTGMELDWRYYHRMRTPKEIAATLKNYACTPTDIKVAEKALALAVPAIKAGALTTEVSQAAAKWLDARFT